MRFCIPAILAAILAISSCSPKKASPSPAAEAAAMAADTATATVASAAAISYAAIDSNDAFIDFRDGKVYKHVAIGGQVWMAENLNYEAAGSRCYGDKPERCKEFGRLYSWETALGACPDGWHLPSNAEWDELYRFADDYNPYRDRKRVGAHLKVGREISEFFFDGVENVRKVSYSGDEFGFSALLGGSYSLSDSKFKNFSNAGHWWSASYRNPFDAYYMYMEFRHDDASLHYAKWGDLHSVRCLKGSPAAPSSSSSAQCPAHNPSASFCDSRDGKVYKTAAIGSQLWMAENLNYEAQYNGSECPAGKPENCKKYGRRYYWETALKACPSGWHLPSNDEWEALASYIESDKKCYKCDGKHLKAASGWKGKNNDSYGFSALPASVWWTKAMYFSWWTSSEHSDRFAYTRYMHDDHESVAWDDNDKASLSSVRCVNDSAIAISSGSGFSSSSLAIAGNAFADSRDGRVYRYAEIGSQTWMAENLKYEAAGSRCSGTEYQLENCEKYGRFYDWNTAIEACPEGWHLPTTEEWDILVNFAGGEKKAGKKLKAKNGWQRNGYGTDDYGFSALPSDAREGHWWADSWGYESKNAKRATIYDSFYGGHLARSSLRNVRCLKGAPILPPPPPPKPETGAFFTDSRDGKKYRTVKIGSQNWMAENLNYDIKDGFSSNCYAGKPENCEKYGRLYGWMAALEACPAGWHLPSNDEWKALIDFAGGEKAAGKKLKAKGGWRYDEGMPGYGSDDFGFSALPGGTDYEDGGKYYDIGYSANWWTSSRVNQLSHSWSLRNDRNFAKDSERDWPVMFSVRCVMD